ncbi:MAG: histidinol dehydrogenase [Xanthomonadales bacterium]|nr:histidinol dehydrogenase [Xanthomonadales bacterium]
MSIPLALKTWSTLSRKQQLELLQRPTNATNGRRQLVTEITTKVRTSGDQALAELTLEFDQVSAESLCISAAEITQAAESIDRRVYQAIEDAGKRIRLFHSADMPADIEVETAPGIRCEVRYKPLSPVGLYIPGGSAPLVSSVLMLALPAKLAGCAQVVICSPPDANGKITAEILAAASYAGVDQVFCVGGAQAIAAMAYGTESIPRCSKIFGPGNAWVTEAKQQVSQDPQGAAIDMPAGPSEALVIADEHALADNGAEFIAWDLLSQAEHGPDSQVLLITDSQTLALAVIAKLESLLEKTPRAKILKQSLQSAQFILVDNLQQALEISEEYAPEHLIINTRNPRELAKQVNNAGSVFIGRWTPESLGDYCSGTNHVLPTYGWARSHGALGVSDFKRRMTLQEASRSGLQLIGPTAEILAEVEGLNAHKMAVTSRLSMIDSAAKR